MTAEFIAALAGALTTRSRVALAADGRILAAVLVPLLVVDGAPSLLFTRRATHLPHHQGQIAFPGGRHADEDPDRAATALREAHEEIGLAPTDVQLLGPLDDLETSATRFLITPFVGLVPHPYPWRPSPDEVDAIFTVPLETLRAPDTERRERWDFGGREIEVVTYPVEGHVIWGATQRITRNLLDVLETL